MLTRLDICSYQRMNSWFQILYRPICLGVKVFANGPCDLGSFSGRVIKKWNVIASCLTLKIIRYVSHGKWINPGKGVLPSPIPRSCSY